MTGSGTIFTNLSPGDYIRVGQSFIEIDSITNNTSLTLKSQYRGKSDTSQSYVGQSMKKDIIIKGLTITGSSSTGLYIRAITNSLINSLIIINCLANLEINDSSSNNISNVIISNSSGYGIKITDCYSNNISLCKVKGILA